jgi:hypothetical protein
MLDRLKLKKTITASGDLSAKLYSGVFDRFAAPLPGIL